MGWIYLALVTVMGTAIWPLARWALSEGGNPRVMGFWISLTVATASLTALIIKDAPLFIPSLWVAGILMGTAYAVGFIMLIMRCLQTGPAGPTVTINNSAMIFGVLYGVLWLEPHFPNGWILAGSAGVLAALIMIGMGRPPSSPQIRAVSHAWLPMVLAGGAFSGLSFMTQTYAGLCHPGVENSLLFMFVGFCFAAVILFLSVVRDPRILLRQKRELAGGVILGLSNTIGTLLVLLTFRKLGAEIVLPVSVTSPMILIMILGVVFYKEHLSRLMWAGCLGAALAVGLIGFGSTQNVGFIDKGNHLAPATSVHAPAQNRQAKDRVP